MNDVLCSDIACAVGIRKATPQDHEERTVDAGEKTGIGRKRVFLGWSTVTSISHV